MNLGKRLFAQFMDFLPWKTFHRMVDRHGGDRYVKSMTCTEPFRVMAFAHISNGKLHDVNVLDAMVPEAGAVYLNDNSTRS